MQVMANPRSIELKIRGLMRAVGVFVEHPRGVVAPEAGHTVRDPSDRASIVFCWTEVISGGESCGFRPRAQEPFSQGEITEDRLKHMLPGADGVWPADANRFACQETSNEVGNKTVR